MTKTILYQVRCTINIVNEMIRYEGSKIIASTDQECNPKFVGTDLESEYTTFLYKIEGNCCVNRWLSFGVRPVILETQRKPAFPSRNIIINMYRESGTLLYRVAKINRSRFYEISFITPTSKRPVVVAGSVSLEIVSQYLHNKKDVASYELVSDVDDEVLDIL